MDRHSEVLIQGTNVPGGRITVNVPVDHTFSTDFARNTYPYDGAQYIWKRSWGDSPNNSSSSSSSDSGTDFTTGVFQLVGWGITTTATVGYLGVTKVAYPATKFVVTKAIVPATVFTGKYTWKGMKYVATTTVPQVYSFTKNTIIPGVIKVASDIVSFIKELISKVLNK